MCFFFFSSRRRHTRLQGDWSSDVCSSDLVGGEKRQSVEGGRSANDEDVRKRVGEERREALAARSLRRRGDGGVEEVGAAETGEGRGGAAAAGRQCEDGRRFAHQGGPEGASPREENGAEDRRLPLRARSPRHRR